jgi:hypothetical protein
MQYIGWMLGYAMLGVMSVYKTWVSELNQQTVYPVRAIVNCVEIWSSPKWFLNLVYFFCIVKQHL